jgi:signal recognition particle GTPase
MTSFGLMHAGRCRDKLPPMNKRLESLIDRIPTWPPEAQDWAAESLAEVEKRVRILQSLTPEERVKLEALRETINRSIAEGGSYTDEEVAAGIEASLDEWERERKDK